MKKLVHFTLFFLMSLSLMAQNNEDVAVLRTVIIDGDTMLVSSFPEFAVEADRNERVFASEKEKKKYDQLRKDVETVWPYAELAGNLLNGYNEELALIKTKKEKKEFTKKIQEEIEAEFGSELIDLSMNQQVILIKLIDRQTGDTSYEILKDYRGTVTAFFFQGLARIFGHNLKNDYDGNGDEEMIEEIIADIEREKIDVVYSELK